MAEGGGSGAPPDSGTREAGEPAQSPLPMKRRREGSLEAESSAPPAKRAREESDVTREPPPATGAPAASLQYTVVAVLSHRQLPPHGHFEYLVRWQAPGLPEEVNWENEKNLWKVQAARQMVADYRRGIMGGGAKNNDGNAGAAWPRPAEGVLFSAEAINKLVADATNTVPNSNSPARTTVPPPSPLLPGLLPTPANTTVKKRAPREVEHALEKAASQAKSSIGITMAKSTPAEMVPSAVSENTKSTALPTATAAPPPRRATTSYRRQRPANARAPDGSNVHHWRLKLTKDGAAGARGGHERVNGNVAMPALVPVRGGTPSPALPREPHRAWSETTTTSTPPVIHLRALTTGTVALVSSERGLNLVDVTATAGEPAPAPPTTGFTAPPTPSPAFSIRSLPTTETMTADSPAISTRAPSVPPPPSSTPATGERPVEEEKKDIAKEKAKQAARVRRVVVARREEASQSESEDQEEASEEEEEDEDDAATRLHDEAALYFRVPSTGPHVFSRPAPARPWVWRRPATLATIRALEVLPPRVRRDSEGGDEQQGAPVAMHAGQAGVNMNTYRDWIRVRYGQQQGKFDLSLSIDYHNYKTY